MLTLRAGAHGGLAAELSTCLSQARTELTGSADKRRVNGRLLDREPARRVAFILIPGKQGSRRRNALPKELTACYPESHYCYGQSS